MILQDINLINYGRSNYVVGLSISLLYYLHFSMDMFLFLPIQQIKIARVLEDGHAQILISMATENMFALWNSIIFNMYFCCII